MTSKLSLVAILLALISATTQLTLVKKHDVGRLHHGVDFKKIGEHLDHHHEQHTKGTPTNLLNIQNVNLYLNSASKKLALPLRSEIKDKLCQVGRCGCGGGNKCDDDDDDSERREQDDKIDEIVTKLRCSGDRCEDLRERREQDDKIDEIVTKLRCSDDRCEDLREGDRCGCRHKKYDRNGDDRDDDDDDESQALRCKNNRCGRGNTRSDKDLKSELERYGKKYKINEDLDAIVLDLSNFNGLLGKLNNNNGRKLKKQRLSGAIPDLDLDYYFSLDDEDRNSKPDVDGFVINIDDADLAEALLGQAKKKGSLKPNMLSELYEDNQRSILNKAWNYVNNRKGDKDLPTLSREQRYQLQKLKSQIQGRYTQPDKTELWAYIKAIVLNSDQDNRREQLSEPLQWSVDYNHENVKRTLKRLLPLTHKQKLKLQKKNSKLLSFPFPPPQRRVISQGDQYGLPFELQIEGLGHVNPE